MLSFLTEKKFLGFPVGQIIGGIGCSIVDHQQTKNLPAEKMLYRYPEMVGCMAKVVTVLKSTYGKKNPYVKTAEETQKIWQEIEKNGAFWSIQRSRLWKCACATGSIAISLFFVVRPFVNKVGFTPTAAVTCAVLLTPLLQKLTVLALGALHYEDLAESVEAVGYIYNAPILSSYIVRENGDPYAVAKGFGNFMLFELLTPVLNNVVKPYIGKKLELPEEEWKPSPKADNREWLRDNLTLLDHEYYRIGEEKGSVDYAAIKNIAWDMLTLETKFWFDPYLQAVERKKQPESKEQPSSFFGPDYLGVIQRNKQAKSKLEELFQRGPMLQGVKTDLEEELVAAQQSLMASGESQTLTNEEPTPSEKP